MALLAAYLLTSGPAAKPLLEGRWSSLTIGGALATGSAVALEAVASRAPSRGGGGWLSRVAAICALAGGAALRFGVVHAGHALPRSREPLEPSLTWAAPIDMQQRWTHSGPSLLKGVISVPIRDPNQGHQAWGEAFNRGDIEGLLSLYAQDAVIVPEPGKQVSGKDAIRAALEGFLSLKVPMTIETLSTVVVGDIAQTRGRWALRGTGPDGKPVEMGSATAEVWKRQPDGTWLTVIDDPWV